jgi:hypothetical protein
LMIDYISSIIASYWTACNTSLFVPFFPLMPAKQNSPYQFGLSQPLSNFFHVRAEVSDHENCHW